MRFVFILTLIFMQLSASNIRKISIDNQPFTTIKESYNEYGSKGKIIRFYQGEEQNKSTMRFSFILYQKDGSCSDSAIEDGVYEINGSTITFYSFWERTGYKEDAPYGARIQRYKVLPKSGKFEKISSKLYIEESKRGYDEESGMQYLFSKPKTDKEKKLFLEYIKRVEKLYDGEFIFDKEADKLLKVVKKALKRSIKSLWKRK